MGATNHEGSWAAKEHQGTAASSDEAHGCEALHYLIFYVLAMHFDNEFTNVV
jgi:hypothetical protein